MYQTTYQPNNRLNVADALRGIAIIGIILLHYVSHLGFFQFPETTNTKMLFLNNATWTFVTLALERKMYSIFALLFGLSFFIQNDNQMQKGNDFSLRFVWRMLLLMIFGLVNTFFFSADILVSYALFGMLLPLVGKLNTKVIVVITIFLLIQPVQIFQIITTLHNPDYQLVSTKIDRYSEIMGSLQANGSLWACGWNGLKQGLLLEIPWNIESERITQLPGLFLLGILIGRTRLFYNENNNMKKWIWILIVSLLFIFLIHKCYGFIPDNSYEGIFAPILLLLKAWRNLSQTLVYISLLVLLFYFIPAINKLMMKLTYFGKASMTNYSLHSVFGSMIFYGWGFGLYRYCGPATSFLIGMGTIILQYFFCLWWFKTHNHGPLEGLWKRLTWINIAKLNLHINKKDKQ